MIVWQNTFDGPNETTVSAANSADYGDPIASVTGTVTYSTDWIVQGTASVRLGSDDGSVAGDLYVDDPSGAASTWSLRMYMLIPTGGSTVTTRDGAELVFFDAEFSVYQLLGQDVSDNAASIIGNSVRVEITRSAGTATGRLWWTNPEGEGAPDREVSVDSSGWVSTAQIALMGGGYSTPAVYVDELAIAEGEWIGPAVPPQQETGEATGRLVIRGEADGYATGSTPAEGAIVIRGHASGSAGQQSLGEGSIVIHGEADGLAGATEATAPPVRDMWIGPLGLMRRMVERGEWERTPDLGVEAHVSLHGQVTAARPRWAPRSTELVWDRLTRADADALHELALVHARADSTVCVIDPDAANLLTPEQSRGRPLTGSLPGAVEELYRLDGTGTVAVGLLAGTRHACTQDAAAGDELTWLHPYYGARGWPVMPGWPVWLTADVGEYAVAASARLWLTFRDWAGAVISSAAGVVGSGSCEADAPEGAVTVTPHMVLAEPVSGLGLVGEASLSYTPPAPDIRPLGNGCPVYAVTGLTDTPQLPWRTTALQLQEVRALAVR